MREISDIYDQLHDFESRKKTDYYPIHKKLNLDKKNDDLIDWIIENIPFKETESVLDAGCGTGYTLFRLAKEKGIKGHGISISRNEIRFANEQLKKESQTLQISFSNNSFDLPIDCCFNKIIAIESLKHSQSIDKSLKNILKSISRKGTVIIADDFIKESSTIVEKQKSLWNAPSFISYEYLVLLFKKFGHFKIEKYNFTDKVKTRPLFLLAILISLTYLAKWLSIKSLRTKIEIYLGGLLLELLYVKKKVSYYVITATKIS